MFINQMWASIPTNLRIQCWLFLQPQKTRLSAEQSCRSSSSSAPIKAIKHHLKIRHVCSIFFIAFLALNSCRIRFLCVYRLQSTLGSFGMKGAIKLKDTIIPLPRVALRTKPNLFAMNARQIMEGTRKRCLWKIWDFVYCFAEVRWILSRPRRMNFHWENDRH